MASPPYVNGVSPCEGPPGTKVKIWGEDLGLSEADVISIKICGQECIETMEWVSDRKIVCSTSHGIGKGRVLVTSLSGGAGSCSVYFTGLAPMSPGSPRLGPLEGSSIWIEETWDMFNEDISSGGVVTSSDNSTHTIDPLGINKGGVKRKPSEDILAKAGSGSGDLLAEDFNPVRFLIENHCATNFDQLRHGLDHLRDQVNKSQQAPSGFIRDNLDSFIQCYDTLSVWVWSVHVNTILIQNESESEGGSITDKMEGLLRNTTLEAEALFHGLLKRKLKADSARNALTVLHRYRFLFNLPRSIERNIKNNEYEIVTNDYERAKSLFAGTKVKVFAKVLKEVEKLVTNFRFDLRKQLLDNPNSLDNQKRFIKYLLDLDYMGDPCWECIDNMHSWIVQQLLTTKEQYQNESDQPYLTDISHTHSRTSSLTSGRNLPRPPTESHDFTKPKRILFVEKLIEIVASNLPNFVKLGQSYFKRTLFSTVLSENQDNIISDNITNKRDVFEDMLLEIAEVYTDLVNYSLFEDAPAHLPPERVAKLGDWKPFDDDLAEVSGAWLPLCVRKIRDCLSLLQDLPLTETPLSLVQQLSLNVCTLSADTLFLRTTRDIEGLIDREDWRVQDEDGLVITSLPVLFENIVVDVLLTLKEIVIETHPGESRELRQPLLSASVDHFQGLLEDFCECLSFLARGKNEEKEGRSLTTARQEGSEDTLHQPTREEQLLLVLSNSYYTGHFVTPRLFECFTSHGYPECPEINERFIEQLIVLDKQVFEAYISLKVGPLVSLIGPGIHGGYFNWNTEFLPCDIRDYLKEILLYFVHVHAEVSSISEHITNRVISQLLEELSNELLKQLQSVESFSNQGKLNGFVEVLAVKQTLEHYFTPSIDETFQEMFALVDSKTIEKKYALNIRDIFEKFTESNTLQFRCFDRTMSF